VNIIAFIFARGGSKGLPGKNIRMLGGKPLIAWSIEQASSISNITRIIVSTDSEEIAEVARQYGAETPFIRPAELSGDDAPEWLAWRHALNYIKNVDGALPDLMLSIPTTSPLRQQIDIEKCINEYQKGIVDVVVTISESSRSPYFNMVKYNEDGTVSLVMRSNQGIYRRQDAPKTYDMTTVCYAIRPEFVMSNETIFSGKVGAVKVPAERCVDIDTLLDFEFAEFLLIKNR
jgi:CMP-N-acetylneuraminic acid synthetase